MFQSVIQQREVHAGRMGTGVWVSLFLHAGLFGALLGLSHRDAPQPERKEHEIVFKQPAAPPRGNPHPPAPLQQVAPKPKPKPRQALVQPKEIKPLPPPPVTAPPEPPASTPEPVDPTLPYLEGSHPDGVDTGGIVGVPLPDTLLNQGGGGGTGEEVVPFGAGMKPPRLLSTGVPLEYTSQATLARVQGVVVTRCVITRQGTVEDCRVIKGQPFMDEAVVSSLTSRRYEPLTYQGQTVNVSYTFNVNLRLP
jgi:periplasmic protein TonB